jgi:hypothetical protein
VTILLAVVAETIQGSFGIEGRTHGHKNGERGYPLWKHLALQIRPTIAFSGGQVYFIDRAESP